ncbi:MAG: hypothetical protein GTN78_18870 [Gemmatimonadales bacterium]|nr:hypothetical protein [Gemmatimonadales bacterium]
MALARKQRGLYWLYLVYGATTTRARPVVYRDPVGLWEDGEIDLDFEVLLGRAPVPEEGAETEPPEGDLQAREDSVDRFEGGSVQQFVDDEDGYLKWLAANPGGFVINSYRRPRANYLMLHQATCSTVSGDPAKGRLWTSGYSKTCAATREQLERWAEREVGGRAILCERCRP